MNGINEFHFLRPLWLFALPLLLWLVHTQRHHFAKHSAWSDVVAPELLPHLLNDSSASSNKRWLYPLAQLAALLLILALAGPSWRQLPQPVFDTPAHRVLVVDLSPAMDAQDLKPSRLKRSQLVAQQLLEQQSEGDTGLVAFAAEAFPVVPLTSDRNTVSHLLHSLSSDIMPASGDNLAAGIRQATELLKQTGASRGDIVVFTASPVTPGVRQAAEQAYGAGFRLHVLGAGTKKGAPIPALGGWLKDDKGAITLSRLEESALRALAQSNGGRYRNVENAGASYQLDLSAELAAATEDSGQNLQADMWQDEGPWLLLPLLLISAFAFRRGWLMLLLLSLPLSTPQPAYAGWWKKDDQQAYQHYQAEDYASAAETFDDENWKASALYEAGQYQDAAELWKQEKTAQSRYNLGNALARAGELDAAIKAYEEALQRNPEFADALANKELLEQLKQQQEQKQDGQQDPSEGEEQDSEQQSDENQQSQSDDSSQEQAGEQQDAENADQEPQPSEQESEQPPGQEQQAEQAEPSEDEPSEAEQAQATTSEQAQKQDEQEQAVQQWLKRIPDDPGGLLRRKFERMEQRRREAQR